MNAPAEYRDDLARDAWHLLRELTAAPDVIALEHEFMHGSGLSGGPVRALRALFSTGPQSMRALADALGCDKSYVTGLVKPLTAKGLATLDADPADGRVKVVTLTVAGHEIAKRAVAVHETPPAAIAGLSHEQLAGLVATLSAAARA